MRRFADAPNPHNHAHAARAMIELIRTNDVILLSLVESILTAENVRYFVADRHMSVLEGSTGFLPRRVLVAPDHEHRARRLVAEAGLADELRPARHD